MTAGETGHGHEHRAAHELGRHDGNRRRLALTLGLVLLYMAAEVVGGILTGSLALLADAGHMLSDAAALGLALFAIWFARRPAPSTFTFGYHRTEILAALVNGATLLAISAWIVVEAVRRFRVPHDVDGGPMMAVAAGGLLVNLAGLWILHGGREANLNVRGAWLHVLTDALGSVQAMLAGGLIWALGWTWADPVASLLIAALVLWSAWALVRESVSVLMQRAPGHVSVDELREAILGIDGVAAICDMHVWTVTTGLDSMSAHVVVEEGRSDREMLRAVRELVHARFGIDHVTVQIEPEGFEEPDAGF